MSELGPWRHDPAAPPAVRDLLARAGRAGPSQAERAALARSLAPRMEPPAGSPRGWIAGGVAVAVCIAAIAWLAWPREQSAAERAAPPAPPAQPVLGAAPTPSEVPVTTAPTAPNTEGAPVRERAARPRAPGVAAPALDVEEADGAEPQAPPAELALLREARGSLRSDPEHALELLALHARHHPRGVFAEEREALAVEALVRAGRSAEARRRADALLAARPGTAHRARIEELLAH